MNQIPAATTVHVLVANFFFFALVGGFARLGWDTYRHWGRRPAEGEVRQLSPILAALALGLAVMAGGAALADGWPRKLSAMGIAATTLGGVGLAPEFLRTSPLRRFEGWWERHGGPDRQRAVTNCLRAAFAWVVFAVGSGALVCLLAAAGLIIGTRSTNQDRALVELAGLTLLLGLGLGLVWFALRDALRTWAPSTTTALEHAGEFMEREARVGPNAADVRVAASAFSVLLGQALQFLGTVLS